MCVIGLICCVPLCFSLWGGSVFVVLVVNYVNVSMFLDSREVSEHFCCHGHI